MYQHQLKYKMSTKYEQKSSKSENEANKAQNEQLLKLTT